ncbi:PhzF family phenazine biosynthesis protein [Amycolatopsis rhizosphaerae]|uniref:PhzF family phenazine biosynthesis protein n=1 Tax=Amycolatopsis rhizosphaerae TaxID=2053003 RepID=A0A558B7I2_9PSEU|nr:PhzF family phenazine biosynthesis isomerase [Amycolatopsis rhizosphaerae]TVT32473.1 PhzF family phenazine biosynthesis protein [Amycolatopsis rhizosphaerae]
MNTTAEVLRYAAFDVAGEGGNPAGVVLDARGLGEAKMLAIAAEVGYSETAFLVREGDSRRFDVRYFSPLAEVPFCGHATIASAVAFALREGVGDLLFRTPAGEVPVATGLVDGRVNATLTSVRPAVREAAEQDVEAALEALRWQAGDLDPAMPPRVANAGASHLVLAVAGRDRLAELDYDFDALGAVMARCGWTTLQLVWRDGATGEFHARDPFPPGGIYEDPATGAAAAAFGAYLRELALVETPARIVIHQGADMGRPCRLVADIPAEAGTGISVSGTATEIAA